jgi:uncharacterized protein (DUF488 family)
MARDPGRPQIFTVGHSNLSADDFFALLERHAIRTLADVRLIPASRRHPQFGREALAAACAERGIEYHWRKDLGGRRRPVAGSPHRAWEVDAFRGYADYAETAEFAAALAELEAIARARPTAVMCAEARWWQCHRRLLADRLLVNGWEVLHVMGAAKPSRHELPDFARLDGDRIVYDVGATRELELGRGAEKAPRTARRTPSS